MKVWARFHPTAANLASGEPALLLEGSWPGISDSSARWSLDRVVDARSDWIDLAAVELAERAFKSASNNRLPAEFSWLNVVKLRYALVKLLRVVAFFRELWPLAAGEPLELFLDQRSDEPYALLLAEMCAAAGSKLQVTWLADDAPQTSPALPDAWWRRGLSRANAWAVRGRRRSADDRPRIVLCGNPRILDPVCAELARRGQPCWWIYERLAIGSWLRWAPRGIGQIVVGSLPETRIEDRTIGWSAEPTSGLGDTLGALLSASIKCWIEQQAAALAEQQALLLMRIRDEFRRRRPTHVVLDQDATPLNRAVVLAARDVGARSLVVQHGVPYIRFGFTPLEADAICAWGDSSRAQFERWGIPSERIHITGFPPHDQLAQRMDRVRKQPSNGLADQYLLLATPVPRDDRPDAVSYHQTTETYTAMMRMAFETLSDAGIGRLVVKLHPRDPESAIVRGLANQFPRLKTRIIERGELAELLVGTACVLSCASSAGVEATLAGVPVIQLMPTGSLDLIPDAVWGLLGTARTRDELEWLLDRARRHWAGGLLPPNPRVFAGLRSSAASRVVDVLLAPGRNEPADNCHDRTAYTDSRFIQSR